MDDVIERCPVPGCLRLRRPGHVMCRHHWYMVPKSVRDQVWREYRAATGSAEHLQAIRIAIGAVAGDLEHEAGS